MAIQCIDSRKSIRPLQLREPDLSASVFYRLIEDVPANSELASFDFQAGDSVEVDPFAIPTSEDILLMSEIDGTQFLVSFDESAGFNPMSCEGVVVTHLRPWTERRRKEHERVRFQQEESYLAMALVTLAKLVPSRLPAILQSSTLLRAKHIVPSKTRLRIITAWR